jgi:hypothetical protein
LSLGEAVAAVCRFEAAATAELEAESAGAPRLMAGNAARVGDGIEATSGDGVKTGAAADSFGEEDGLTIGEVETAADVAAFGEDAGPAADGTVEDAVDDGAGAADAATVVDRAAA